MSVRVERLDPAGYRRTPWKNGGGTTVDIAGLSKPGVDPAGWDGMLWRYGRTAIVAPAPFSDLSGFERVQVLVGGSGLVLETPEGEIDVRRPFAPVRFDGATKIVSRLEAGPVEVVNLLGAKDAVRIDIRVLRAGDALDAEMGVHIVHCPKGSAEVVCFGETHALGEDHALRLDAAVPVALRGQAGSVLVASIYS